MKEFEEIPRQKHLPAVGQMIRSKKYGTIWRVMEKRRSGATSTLIPRAASHA